MIKHTKLFVFRTYNFSPMNRFYILFILLLVFTPRVGFSQKIKKEVSLEKIEDSTANIKRFDVVNYQVVADQKYFKNNPEAQSTAVQTVLDEQLVSGKSAEDVADANKTTHAEIAYDQRTTTALDQQVALDTKLLVSAEEKAVSKQVTLDVDYSSSAAQVTAIPIAKPESNSSALTNEFSEPKKTESEQEVVVKQEVEKPVDITSKEEVTNNELIKASPIVSDTLTPTIAKIDSVKVVPAKPTSYPSTIEFKDNNSVVPTEKHVPAPKKVEPTPVAVEPTPTIVAPTPIQVETVTPTTKPGINREQQVIDELINSGNYDVYDDGKYIKISRKKKIK